MTILREIINESEISYLIFLDYHTITWSVLLYDVTKVEQIYYRNGTRFTEKNTIFTFFAERYQFYIPKLPIIQQNCLLLYQIYLQLWLEKLKT